MKTRGISMATQDSEVEKIAKMAVILREICSNLEAFKYPKDETKTCQRKQQVNDIKSMLIIIEQSNCIMINKKN